MSLIIYSEKGSSRFRYAMEVLFGYLLKTDHRFSCDKQEFIYSALPKLNYSRKRLTAEELFLPAGSLLFEQGIHAQAIEVSEFESLPVFFQLNDPDADLPFDFPAMMFFLLSRYEEYLPHQKDGHGRFPAQQSLAFKHGFLRQPLLDQWALKLKAILKRKYPGLEFEKQHYIFQPTYDIDLAWAYRHKRWWLNLGGYAKDILKGQFGRVFERLDVHLGGREDPFFTFSFLDDLHGRWFLRPIYFFLLGDYGKYDKNISPKSAALRKLIQESRGKQVYIGIHPSYRSNFKNGQLDKELGSLQLISGEKAVKSRQHYLKLQLPGTYRQLIAAGIVADYSMGYASDIGFRAGISRPFPWYDLEREQQTGLMVHPFQLMDVTLRHYLSLSPKEALAAIRVMIEIVKKVEGTFCSLWHNSSFSEIDGWGSWKEVYEKLLEMASPTGKDLHIEIVCTIYFIAGFIF